MSIKLYNYFRSSTSYRARIALHLKNLNFEYIPVHLLKDGGEQNKSSYRDLNPMGGVPTLNQGDFNLGQSSAILEYLDESYPNTYQLLPENKQLRGKIRQFCQIINADTHAYGNLRTMAYLEKTFKATEQQKKEWIQHWMSEGLKACEKMISKTSGKYCFGDDVTMADVFLIPQIFSAQRFDVDMSSFPTLMKVNNECLKHEAFLRAHPLKQVDTPEELRK